MGPDWFSAAVAIGGREQVHYSAWQNGMKRQSPVWARHNAELSTPTTPHSDSADPIHISQVDLMQHGAGTLPPFEFSGRGAQGGLDASTHFNPQQLPALTLCRHKCSVSSWVERRDLTVNRMWLLNRHRYPDSTNSWISREDSTQNRTTAQHGEPLSPRFCQIWQGESCCSTEA